MAKVRMRQELSFKAPTRVGLLADVSQALFDAGVDIEAIGAYDKEGNGEFLLVTSNDRTAAEALAPLEGQLDIGPVVTVEVDNEPGALAAVSRAISDAGLNISQIHATAVAGALTATIVMRVEDEARVVGLLEAL